ALAVMRDAARHGCEEHRGQRGADRLVDGQAEHQRQDRHHDTGPAGSDEPDQRADGKHDDEKGPQKRQLFRSCVRASFRSTTSPGWKPMLPYGPVAESPPYGENAPPFQRITVIVVWRRFRSRDDRHHMKASSSNGTRSTKTTPKRTAIEMIPWKNQPNKTPTSIPA